MRRSVFLVLAALLSILAQAQDTLHLTLAEAEKLALDNNPQVTSAKFTAAAGAQIPAQFHAAFEPQMFGSLTGVGADSGSRLAAGALNNPVVYNRLGSGFSGSQLITDFGRTGNLVASAKYRAESQGELSSATRAQVLLTTDRAYYGVLRSQALLKVAQETVRARQLVADQVSLLAKSKLKSTLDVSFANVNLADAKLLLAGAQNDIRAAVVDLATAMGIPGEKAFVLAEEPLPDPLPDKIEPLIQEALGKRPELASLRLERSAAERFAQAERALAFPSVGLVGTAGFVPAGQAVVPGRYGAVGVNVNIPVFNGGLFKARRTEAELRTKAAEQNVNDLRNRIARDVRVAYLNAETGYERVGLSQQLLDQALMGLDLAQQRYTLGLGSIVELSQAQLNVTSAQIANTSAKYDYQAQRSVLAFQVGALQ